MCFYFFIWRNIMFKTLLPVLFFLVSNLTYATDPSQWIGRWEGIWEIPVSRAAILNVSAIEYNGEKKIIVVERKSLGKTFRFQLSPDGKSFNYDNYNPNTSGSVIFTLSEDGKSLDASYSNPSGGKNRATLVLIQK